MVDASARAPGPTRPPARRGPYTALLLLIGATACGDEPARPGDDAAPTVEEVAVVPDAVVVEEAAVQVTATATVRDAAGVASVRMAMGPEEAGAEECDASLVTGDADLGSWECVYTIPPTAAGESWRVWTVRVRDGLGNEAVRVAPATASVSISRPPQFHGGTLPPG